MRYPVAPWVQNYRFARELMPKPFSNWPSQTTSTIFEFYRVFEQREALSPTISDRPIQLKAGNFGTLSFAKLNLAKIICAS